METEAFWWWRLTHKQMSRLEISIQDSRKILKNNLAVTFGDKSNAVALTFHTKSHSLEKWLMKWLLSLEPGNKIGQQQNVIVLARSAMSTAKVNNIRYQVPRTKLFTWKIYMKSQRDSFRSATIRLMVNTLLVINGANVCAFSGQCKYTDHEDRVPTNELIGVSNKRFN